MNDQTENQGRTGGIINLDFNSKEELYKAFMPFVKNGGLFIPTTRQFELGNEMFVVLSIPDDGEKIPVSCRVVWVTPLGAEGNRQPGIGVQFKDNGIARARIETCLAGTLNSQESTYTM